MKLNQPTETLETDSRNGSHLADDLHLDHVAELDCILPGEPALEIALHPDLTTAADHAPRVNAYREAGLRFLSFYDQVLSFVIEYENPRLAAWVIAIASGRRALTGGISQSDLADRFGCTKANVSKCVKAVQSRFGNSIAGIEPMPGQRTMDACAKFAHVRNLQVQSNENHTTNT